MVNSLREHWADSASRLIGRPKLRYKDTCKRALKCREALEEWQLKKTDHNRNYQVVPWNLREGKWEENGARVKYDVLCIFRVFFVTIRWRFRNVFRFGLPRRIIMIIMSCVVTNLCYITWWPNSFLCNFEIQKLRPLISDVALWICNHHSASDTKQDSFLCSFYNWLWQVRIINLPVSIFTPGWRSEALWELGVLSENKTRDNVSCHARDRPGLAQGHLWGNCAPRRKNRLNPFFL